jgi:hypothetical protein
MFVTASDFNVVPYDIPNLTGSGPINSFNSYVEREEKALLKSLLGKSLYDSFIEGLDTDYPEQIWLDLRDGGDYVIMGKTYEWVGMKEMLIPYIKSEWLHDNYTQLSGIGTVKGKAENATVVNPRRKIAELWNEFTHIAGNCHNRKDTLWGYLSILGAGGTFDGTFDDTFDTFGAYLDFVFKDPGLKNWGNI